MEKKKTKNKEEIVERKREGKKRSKTKLAEKKNFSKASAIRTIQNHLHCNYVSVIISARVTNK